MKVADAADEPKVAKKGEKQAENKGGKIGRTGEKKRRKKRKESYNIYTYNALKQVLPDVAGPRKAMSIMSGNNIFERIVSEASRLAKQNKRSKISSRLLVPAELAKDAVSEGTNKSKYIYTLFTLFE